ERFEEEISERRGEDAQIAVEHVPRGHTEDFLGAAVHDHHALLGPNGHHAARHALEDSLVELLLVLELVMEPDVTNGRGEVAPEIEQRLGFPTAVRPAGDALAQGENAHELSSS